MMLVMRIADLQRFVRSRGPSSGRLGACALLLVAVAAISSCKEPDGSGLMSMFIQTLVPADYANKAWKVDLGICSYTVAFDDRSFRTDLMQCGDKVAFNRFKTVVSAGDKESGSLKFTTVAVAQVSCKDRAKNAAEMNPFYAKMNSDGSLSIWLSNERNMLAHANVDYGQFKQLVESAPRDGTACVN